MHAAAVFRNGVDHLHRQGEDSAAIFQRYLRRRAIAHSAQEALQLRPQRFLLRNRGSKRRDARKGGGSNACRIKWVQTGRVEGWVVHRQHQYILPGVIERNVLPRLKEAQLADALGAHAAGGEVGDAAGLEFHAHVGDVHFLREDWETYCAYLLDRRLHERQHDIEIVDHQVEDYVHVERTRAENAETMHFKKHGLREQREGGAHRGVEALKVAGLRNPAMLLRDGN